MTIKEKMTIIAAITLPFVFIFILEKLLVFIVGDYEIQAINSAKTIFDTSLANGKTAYLVVIGMITRIEQFVSFMLTGIIFGCLQCSEANKLFLYIIFSFVYFLIAFVSYVLFFGANMKLFIYFVPIFLDGFFILSVSHFLKNSAMRR